MKTNERRISFVWGCTLGMLAAVLATTGCTSNNRATAPELSPMQRAAIQTKTLNGDAATAFTAALSVLQDHGWQLSAVDKQGGIIQASSLKTQAFNGPTEEYLATDRSYQRKMRKIMKRSQDQGVAFPQWTRWDQLTLQVEPWQKNTVQMRISVVKCGVLPSGAMMKTKKVMVPIPGLEQSLVVDDPQVYTLLFQEIQKAIFVRQGLKGK
jgi:hypothetical protein